MSANTKDMYWTSLCYMDTQTYTILPV